MDISNLSFTLLFSSSVDVLVSSFQLNAGTASQATTIPLNVKDQSNRQDNWDNYIEYNRNFDGMHIHMTGI